MHAHTSMRARSCLHAYTRSLYLTHAQILEPIQRLHARKLTCVCVCILTSVFLSLSSRAGGQANCGYGRYFCQKAFLRPWACSVLQCLAAWCCSVLQRVAACCSVSKQRFEASRTPQMMLYLYGHTYMSAHTNIYLHMHICLHVQIYLHIYRPQMPFTLGRYICTLLRHTLGQICTLLHPTIAPYSCSLLWRPALATRG